MLHENGTAKRETMIFNPSSPYFSNSGKPKKRKSTTILTIFDGLAFTDQVYFSESVLT